MGTNKKTFTKEQIAKMCEMYKNGMPAHEVAAQVHAHSKRVANALREAGVMRPVPNRYVEDWDAQGINMVIRMRREGEPIQKIAAAMGRSTYAIYWVLDRYGVKEEIHVGEKTPPRTIVNAASKELLTTTHDEPLRPGAMDYKKIPSKGFA